MRNRSRSPGAFCAGISMREVALFGEDRAHQRIVGALLRRLAEEHRVGISLVWRQAYGGHGRMKHELNDYLRALRQQREPLPDLIVAATDANCKGLNARTREIADPDPRTPPVVLAIPDPHIERWLLLDGAAFKAVFDQGCRAPDRKCDRDRYKRHLVEAIQAARVEPELRRHRVCKGHHAAPGHRPRCTSGQVFPPFHRQPAHRASTLAAVNGSRARGFPRAHPSALGRRRARHAVGDGPARIAHAVAGAGDRTIAARRRHRLDRCAHGTTGLRACRPALAGRAQRAWRAARGRLRDPGADCSSIAPPTR